MMCSQLTFGNTVVRWQLNSADLLPCTCSADFNFQCCPRYCGLYGLSEEKSLKIKTEIRSLKRMNINITVRYRNYIHLKLS